MWASRLKWSKHNRYIEGCRLSLTDILRVLGLCVVAVVESNVSGDMVDLDELTEPLMGGAESGFSMRSACLLKPILGYD